MDIVRLKPSYKDYLWGGNKLVTNYGKFFPGKNLAESWELSCHKDGPSKAFGKDLRDYLYKNPEYSPVDLMGTNIEHYDDFPILIKFIDAREKLSIQVHPDDDYAKTHEGGFGKTEMWYIMEAEPGAFLYLGCKKPCSKEEFLKHVEDETLDEILNKVPVKAGESYLIEAGCLHAIGEGIVICEVQQNSNLTYRVYDYGRRDAQGNLRELHLDKAMDVAKLEPPKLEHDFGKFIAKSPSFAVEKIIVYGKIGLSTKAESFTCLCITKGEGQVEGLEAHQGQCFFIPARYGNYSLSGSLDAIAVTIL